MNWRRRYAREWAQYPAPRASSNDVPLHLLDLEELTRSRDELASAPPIKPDSDEVWERSDIWHIRGVQGISRPELLKVHDLLIGLNGKPDNLVTVHRALPRGYDIEPGDFVSPTRDYTNAWGKYLQKKYDIPFDTKTITVPARHLFIRDRKSPYLSGTPPVFGRSSQLHRFVNMGYDPGESPSMEWHGHYGDLDVNNV